MTTLNTPDYYRRRLEQSQARAALATTPEVRAIHHDFARRYAELLRAAEQVRERPVARVMLPGR